MVFEGENSSSVTNRSVEYEGPRRIGGNPSLPDPGDLDRVDDILAKDLGRDGLLRNSEG